MTGKENVVWLPDYQSQTTSFPSMTSLVFRNKRA